MRALLQLLSIVAIGFSVQEVESVPQYQRRFAVSEIQTDRAN